MTGSAADIESRLASIIPGLRSNLRDDASRPRRGRVRRVTGTVIHATVEEVRIGEICDLLDPRTGKTTKAEVVGLMDEMAVLVPLGDLTGLSSLTEVVATGKDQLVPVGPGLLGRVISALGEPLDGRPLDGITGTYPVNAYPPSPLERSLISEPIQLGIRALDGLLTCARGQRVGIFGEPGVGKSVLLSDIVTGTDADVAVVALVGERGREVREFIQHQLGPEGLARAVIVVATSDRPAIERVKAAYVATSIAEYFRDQGKHVLLAMDNITRFARAQREIGLASGEPPTRRGFPSSLFAVLPRLLERSGPGRVGSITSLYSVLLEGDGTLDPVAEEIQALLDGHVFLSNELAQRNHFPAVDVLRSRSRLMDTVVPPGHRADAGRLRELLARYADVELLLRVGEYERGNDAVADEAVAKIDIINAFLRQASATHETIDKTRQRMREIVNEGP
ncbi:MULTISPECIES: FliI/YscN family ATPase [unclassified Mesorhizobium]|uniref:FliI/YscN family ATPase n=1 Tax=unclassified Mesorhizobium TaxID=325217 RepID=UPI000F754259|nr:MULTISPECIES: FliI/YscN family ATPase [unclassified Mesorhizobium]AZO22758.1 FliI/YscN family ATPase [Mesorhizobium sp. M1E.F.Ca.ET.045.02.1.1]RUW37590.1 FliI/YscN family ATPase [Mesorhizobium sp. M1E.F.Ca.ET.041.01.1.1]RWD88010.1 MAG: FliI/YscN family ATPase [Mesorhizobium sp.]RWD94064.1 MAG: FliI/YscN family ATPase [Mesorhizobium sp.]TIV53845.1 MAG: FliI/YscN family ATPase [Mesorhizobium sp.]